MQYRTDPKSGNPLPALGFGCMRFPRTPLGQIDMKKSGELVLRAIEGGVNYFDTAYVYLGSEQALGRILHQNQLRDKVLLATKLPQSQCCTNGDFDRLFGEQLAHLHTDFIDYYLIHNLSTLERWQELKAMGIEDWIAGKKKSGQIRRLGFSFHGTRSQFMALLDAYDWDFCQIQYNYLNINHQAGRAGLLRAAEKGLPVLIMEPLLGGKLATGLPQKARDAFRAVRPDFSPAAWALRWLWHQKEVTMVLSGMNAMGQLTENLSVAEAALPGVLSPEEEAAYERAIRAFSETDRVPCTGCNYCMPCPAGVNIPGCFTAYNLSHAMGILSGVQQYATSVGSFTLAKDHSPGRCVGCGHCEKRCPQHIPIMAELKKVRKRLEPFWYRCAKAVMLRRRGRGRR